VEKQEQLQEQLAVLLIFSEVHICHWGGDNPLRRDSRIPGTLPE
jgi:hypothetical protein